MLPKFYGFEASENGSVKLFHCFKVYLPSFKAVQQLENIWRFDANGSQRQALKKSYTLTDSATPNPVRTLNELGLQTSGWISVKSYVNASYRISTCQLDVSVLVSNLVGLPDKTLIAPLKILSFDAEMYSHDNGFPEVIHGDKTIAVCCTLKTYGSDRLERQAFVVWPANQPLQCKTDMEITYCDTSLDLFESFRDYIVMKDPDILTGWNIFGFDMPFLWDEYQSAFSAQKTRGSEALHSHVLGLLQRKGFQTCAELLDRKKSLKASLDPLALRHKLILTKPDKLPELVAGPLRARLRQDLCLEPEPLFGGPEDLRLLREHTSNIHIGPSGPISNKTTHLNQQFRTVIDQPRSIGLKRGEFLGRIALERSNLEEKRMASAAKGDNCYYFWSGRCCVDLMQIIKDDKKLEDNTLKFTAQTYLDPEYGKLDMTPAEIFKAFRTQDPLAMAHMLDYCARDSDIPILLIDKLSYVPIWIEMSRVTFTNLHGVLNGGQQRRVYNLISHFVHGTHALNNSESEWPVALYDDDDEESFKKRRPDYQGATVIEPKSGFYTESVSTLDFESLYPSIMIHFNLCPSVYVAPSKLLGFQSMPGIHLESHEIQHAILQDAKSNTYSEFSRTYSFVKNVQGIIPSLLQHLLKARKVAKRAMAAATNEFEHSVQNGRQLALKVSCNSVYGFFGVNPKRGLMSCKPVAAVTTLKGRGFIEASKSYVESFYTGSSVLYGDTDSIMIKWAGDVSVPIAYTLAEEASAAITDLLRSGKIPGASKPMLESAASAVTLANEKVYKPYLLIQKKNYAGFKYTLKGRAKPDSLESFDTCIDMKGIDAVRRDRTKLIKTLSSAVLDSLLLHQSLDLALQTIVETLDLVARNEAPLDWFVLSKSLKSSYDSENQPHVAAWRRMALRGDSDIPEVGTRMPYVITYSKTKGPLYERTEHPDFVRTSKKSICATYYLENARDVIERLLGPTGLQEKVRGLFAAAIAKSEHRASGNMSLLSFFSKKPKLS
jgi:DNA polymerase elongation subunit (family B)